MVYTWSANHLKHQYRLLPPAGGLLGAPDHRDITDNRGWTTPVRISCGLLHKYIWEDAERGDVRRQCTVFIYDNEATRSASISTREAPTPSPKIISVSGAKNEPKN